MNNIDSHLTSNVYLDIMKKTIKNVYLDCKSDDKGALDQLWNLWKNKMQRVIAYTISNTAIKKGKSCARKPKWKSPEKVQKNESCVTSKDTETNENFPSNSLLGSKNMPCLHCDKITETCIHLSPSYRDPQLTFYHNRISSNFRKVKLFRPVEITERTKTTKIALPLRSKKRCEERSCKIRVPVSLRPNLKSIITPIISKIGRFSTSRAAIMLQNHIDIVYNRSNLPQIDGASDDVYCRIRIISDNSIGKSVQGNLACSDIDSDDDLTDTENSEDPFHCDNIIICQFESVKHKKNNWKLHLKHCIMHLSGIDYIFQEAECVAKF